MELKFNQRKKYINIRNKIGLGLKILIYSKVERIIRKKIIENKLNGYLGIYWPLSGEIDLRNLKSIQGLKLALPRCINKSQMYYHPWVNSNLKEDFVGIPSPQNNQILMPEEISLLLVPALSVDINGTRLGYGGGYFDRLRSQTNWSDVPTRIVLPQACVSNEPLPKEEWDIPFDGWISEEGEIKASSMY